MTYKGIEARTGKPLEIEVREGRVARVSPCGERDLPYLSAGFLDIQVNGCYGIDYCGRNLTVEDVGRLCRALLKSGTTRHCPTIVTNPKELILRNLAIIAAARKEDPFVREAIPAVHIEGPFIASEDGPRGAHDRSFVRRPDFEEFLAWQEAAEGLVKLVTVAPETEGACEFIEKTAKTGTIAAIGHTAATPEQIGAAVSAGARFSTHLGNGCHAQIPRLRNHIWEQLAADELVAGIISDGFHLPGAVVKVIARAKGRDRIVLVSDAAFIAGEKPGVYNWGAVKIEIHADGHISLFGTPYLAGAGHLLDRCVAQFAAFTGCGIGDAVAACTETPSRLLGLPKPGAEPVVGERANFTVFDFRPGDEALSIRRTVAGTECYP